VSGGAVSREDAATRGAAVSGRGIASRHEVASQREAPTAAACPACGGSMGAPFHEARAVPVHSCLMLASRDEALAFPRGDLALAACSACGFIANLRFDPALERYSQDYEETQGFSPRFQRFLRELGESQIARHGLRPGRTALEIGCGKGEYLALLVEASGCDGIGIDPSYRPERLQSPAAARLTFLRELYGPQHASLPADYVCCRHTLEHIAPVQDFIGAVRAAIGDRPEVGVFFEVPDVARVLEEGAFWDLYYEHCSYFTPASLARAFRAAGFVVEDVGLAFEGQYVLLDARVARRGEQPAPHAAEAEPDAAARIERFRERVRRRIAELAGAVRAWKAEGRRIAVWGSGSKAVALLTTLCLGSEIDAVVDINAHKHGRFLAGSGHEILAPAALRELRPDVVLVMNPAYTDEIRAALAELGPMPRLVPL